VKITKTDKATQTLITKYPVFVATFQPGTDVREVLQIEKGCRCIIQWEKQAPSLYVNALTANLLAIH